MVSQMLLGETAVVLERIDRWIRIKTDFDNYVGWVNPGQCAFLSESEVSAWHEDPFVKRNFYRNFTVHHTEIGDALAVPTGALVAFTPEGIRLPDGDYLKTDIIPLFMLNGDIIGTAEKMAGIPYLWGGRSDLGIDCSGLVQLLFSLFGFAMPRDSGQQFALAKPFITDLKDIGQAERGDLVFFANNERRIVHVGLYVTDGCIIHAGPNVRINCFAPAWADKVMFPFDENLAKKFHGVISITDLTLKHRPMLGYQGSILYERSPQIVESDA